MRVRLRPDGGDEQVLCKFDGSLDGLFDSAEAKLGWRPAAFSVGGARLASAEDLEENDEVVCNREQAAEAPSRKRAAEVASSSAVAATDGAADAPDQLQIRVQDSIGNEIFFKVKPSTKVQKILRAFAERMGASDDTYRFHFDGERLPDLRGGRTSDDTIAKWGMEDGDQIDALVEAEGGR
mmetsp:Transcript_23147/g.59048  ORF Transcript_23147/g.59048 Transcript_23147/m.59048 type:complete len:181 (+) Transcript_23147:90-632(+)|eukprot:CAMPEP_0115853972 /NCGR_PEP_ID=MMETSP0287-20121206/13780_1 /TAXON_ID=412157 /ORGANISM="Chrysochromulina rotalis, Strain UIO044" /LENGTH=180 /DNA_ID=CAMNT_0003308067 /DNA_START=85 /DNA_END=627 /DNA_ORIENTATION=+